MITTRNVRPYDGGIASRTDRAAHLIQSLEGCPLELILQTVAKFDFYNSPETKSRSARRWIRHFGGFESGASGKGMAPIIQIVRDDDVVKKREILNSTMKHMPNAYSSGS